MEGSGGEAEFVLSGVWGDFLVLFKVLAFKSGFLLGRELDFFAGVLFVFLVLLFW